MGDGSYPNRLRSFRKRHKLRQSDLRWILEQRIGFRISEATLSRLERGENYPSFTTLAAIARALDEDPAELWSPDEELATSPGGGL